MRDDKYEFYIIKKEKDNSTKFKYEFNIIKLINAGVDNNCLN